MCQFLQMTYSCGHVALCINPGTTVLCDTAIMFGLLDRCDGPPASCFPAPQDVTDSTFFDFAFDSTSDCHMCKGWPGSIPGFVYAHAVRGVYIDRDDDDDEDASGGNSGCQEANVIVQARSELPERRIKRFSFLAKLRKYVRQATKSKKGSLIWRRGGRQLHIEVYDPPQIEYLPQVGYDAYSTYQDSPAPEQLITPIGASQSTVIAEQMQANTDNMVMAPSALEAKGAGSWINIVGVICLSLPRFPLC